MVLSGSEGNGSGCRSIQLLGRWSLDLSAELPTQSALHYGSDLQIAIQGGDGTDAVPAAVWMPDTPQAFGKNQA